MSIFDNIAEFFSPRPIELGLKRSANVGGQMVRPVTPALDTSYDSMLKYSRNELVYACIDKKAQAACDAELIVEKRTKDGQWERIDNHPLVTLMNKPNPYDDGESFRRAWVASENFADHFFCEIVRNGAGQPVALYPLHPAYITPQYRETGTGSVLDHYSYNVNGYEVRYKPEELMIRKRHGSGDVFENRSPLYVALGAIDADTSLTDYVRAFFNNGGAPSGIINFKDRKLSQEDIVHYQQQWIQKYSRGGTNRAGVAVLDSGAVEYQSIGAGLDQLDNENITFKIETRICMAFGVPPALVGAYVGLNLATNNATMRVHLEDFWVNTMSPELKSIRNFLTWNMLPFWEGEDAVRSGNIRVNWDMSQVMALQEDMDALHKRIKETFVAQIITRDEARAALGFDEMEDEELGQAFYKLAEPAPEEPVDGEPVEPEDAPKQLKEAFVDADIVEKKTFDYDGIALGREPTPLEMSIDLKGMVQDYENGRAKMAEVLVSLRSELIVQAAKRMREYNESDIATLSLDVSPKTRTQVKRVADSLFEMGRQQVVKDLARQSGSKSLEQKDLSDKWAKFLARISDLVVARIINEVSTRAINFFVARGLLDQNDEDTIKALRAELEDQSLKTFEDIASQGANSAIGAGRDAEIEARKDEWETVEYSAILDKDTCDYCESADGQQAKDASELPPAPNPDCEGGARCRCFHVAIYKEENA